MQTTILGLGHFLPSRRVTNEELGARLTVDLAGFAARTGITHRHYADPGVGPAQLAFEASTMALERAGLQANDLDFLVFATMTPDVAFPGSGCFLQEKLGVPPIGALDIRAQCLGFVCSVLVADRFLKTGTYDRVLVATGEVHSTSLDFSPEGAAIAPYFGDGAAAAILGGTEADAGLVAGVMHTDATHYERFWCEYPAGRQRPVRMTLENLREGGHYPRVDFASLNPVAERLLREVVSEVLERGGCRERDISHFFLHYLDPGVVQESAAKMGLGPDRVTVTGCPASHIAAAGLPIALSRALAAGAVGSGDLVCVAAVGAGINWGALIVRL